jgi:Bacterial archaeo-eukaryotic release factor family 10
MKVDEFRELADFWSEEGDALSVYFQAPPSSEMAHREEPILAKEKIQQQLATLPGTTPADRADLDRVLGTIAAMKGNHRRTKVIFACKRKNFWRELDVAGDFGVRLDVSHAFELAPLLAQQQARRRYSIVLADRHRARLLMLEAREITEQDQVLEAKEGQEKIRTTGARKSVHLQRKKEARVRQHFAYLADELLHFYEYGDFDALLIGCRDEMWPEIEAALHPVLLRILAGRFAIDPGYATHEEIRDKAQAIIDQRDCKEERELVDKVAGAAASDGLGAMGLQAVIDGLEKREVRALLFPDSRGGRGRGTPPLNRAVSLCPYCQHLRQGERRNCDLCRHLMHLFSCAEEALLRHALGRSIDVRMLRHCELPSDQPIAAWLRFRANSHADVGPDNATTVHQRGEGKERHKRHAA